MSTAEQLPVPPWTLGWRLQRSLAWAEMTTDQMARELGVARSTISRWCNDNGAPPRSIYLRAWAARCGVSLDWLLHGDDRAPASRFERESAGWQYPAHRDRHLTIGEEQAVQEGFRSLIRRGTFDPSAIRVSPDLPIASSQ